MDIDNTQDILDSRDVIERIEDLESTREAYQEDVETNAEALAEMQERIDDMGEDEDDTPEQEKLAEYEADLAAAQAALEAFDADEGEELAKLKAFADQLEGYGDWQHGETIIRESYFTEYAQELCEDIGDVSRDLPGYIVIDWEATANNIRIDYTEAEFDGVTYLMRA